VVVPQTWFFGMDGSLKAFEFLSTFRERCLEVSPPTDFVHELFETLSSVGLESILGIRRVASKAAGTGSWETTPDGMRANVTQFGMEKPKELPEDGLMVRVGWTFTADGRLKGVDWCGLCSHYCQHCHNHNKKNNEN
jgi:hypothetical protein